MLSPKRTKYRKAHKGRIRGVAQSGTTLNFGSFGEGDGARSGHCSADRSGPPRNHPSHEASGFDLDSGFPGSAVSTKPAEVRMGSGKGSPEYWVARVHPGRIMFELDGVRQTSRTALSSWPRQAADQNADYRAGRGGCLRWRK